MNLLNKVDKRKALKYTLAFYTIIIFFIGFVGSFHFVNQDSINIYAEGNNCCNTEWGACPPNEWEAGYHACIDRKCNKCAEHNQPNPVCGNNKCESGENHNNCSQDCKSDGGNNPPGNPGNPDNPGNPNPTGRCYLQSNTAACNPVREWGVNERAMVENAARANPGQQYMAWCPNDGAVATATTSNRGICNCPTLTTPASGCVSGTCSSCGNFTMICAAQSAPPQNPPGDDTPPDSPPPPPPPPGTKSCYSCTGIVNSGRNCQATVTVNENANCPSGTFETRASCLNGPATPVCPAQAANFTITKDIVGSTGPYMIGDLVTFNVRITNTGTTTFTSVRFRDTYDATFIRYIGGSARKSTGQTISDINPHLTQNTPGFLEIANVSTAANSALGLLAPGQYYEFTLRFVVNAPTQNSNTCNVAYGQPNGLPEEQDDACLTSRNRDTDL